MKAIAENLPQIASLMKGRWRSGGGGEDEDGDALSTAKTCERAIVRR